jgi:ferredoxin
MTILEAAEALSIEIPSECRSGFCGQCKTKLRDGVVQMDCEDALSAAEKASGFILACQARPKSDVNIDA